MSEGTFGKVYRAKIGEKLFALKKIKVDDAKMERGFPITSIREIKVLKLLKGHPNMVKLTEIVRSKSQAVYLVFEFVEFDLLRIAKHEQVVFNRLQLKYLFKEIMKGVAFMHSKNIIHRDIKNANILVSA